MPIGRPKYLKGRFDSLHPKKLHAIAINSIGTLIPIKPLFEKLTFNPEANWNPCNKA